MPGHFYAIKLFYSIHLRGIPANVGKYIQKKKVGTAYAGSPRVLLVGNIFTICTNLRMFAANI